MLPEKRIQIAERIFKQCKDLMHLKGTAYSGTVDVLDNFKRNASGNRTKYDVLYIYMAKHLDSIRNGVDKATNNSFPDSLGGESTEGRVIDAINYLIMLLCLHEEDKKRVTIKRKKRK